MEPELRKIKSEQILSGMGVSINTHLPLIESDREAKIRDPKDVARRVLILCCMAAIADGVEREEMLDFLKSENLWEHVSPNEINFFNDANPSEKSLVQASWRSEAIWLLLWALGHIEKLDLPINQCSADTIVDIVPGPGESTKDFIENSKLRPISEILDASDLIYRTHWATRDRGDDNKTEYANLNRDIVMEWHYAINWLTCYNDDDWDDVATDT